MNTIKNENFITEATINNVVTFAIEQSNEKMLQMLMDQKMITLDQCVKRATEKGKTDLIIFLLKKKNDISLAPETVSVPAVVNTRAIVFEYNKWFNIKITTTEFLRDIASYPIKALADLKEGRISLEEMNFQNSGWTALHYICYYAEQISNADLLVKELITKGMNINSITNLNATPLGLLLISFSQTANREMKDHIIDILLNDPKICIHVACKTGDTICGNGCLKYADNLSDSLIKLLMEKHMQAVENFDITTFPSKCSNQKIREKIISVYWFIKKSLILEIPNSDKLSVSDLASLLTLLQNEHIQVINKN